MQPPAKIAPVRGHRTPRCPEALLPASDHHRPSSDWQAPQRPLSRSAGGGACPDSLSIPSNSPVQALVRQLIAEIVPGGANTPVEALPVNDETSGFSKLVLLNVEVDGVRCLLLKQPSSTASSSCSRAGLSPREKEITRLVAKGYPNKTIADVLDISTWTVCTHLRRIFSKLGVCSRAALVAQYLKTERAALLEN